jgi:hypothetical protein
MGVDFATWVYSPCFDTFARTLTFYPMKSQPTVPGFVARGIFDTNEIDIMGIDQEIITDARTELDIFMPEWVVYPVQGDLVDIPWEDDVDGGLFSVADVHGHGNAGGELTLTLQRFEQGRLMGYYVSTSSYSVGALNFALPVLS